MDDFVINLDQLKVECQDCRLSEICLPRGLVKSEMEKLDKIVNRGRPLSRGSVLYHQGDTLNSLFAVHSGSLRSYTVTEDGTEQTLGFYFPGELVGLDGLQDSIYGCTTVALEMTSVCELPFDKLQELCALLPSLQSQMMRLLGKELSDDHDIHLLLGTRTARERLAAFLLSLSKRFSERGFSATEYNLSMSRNDISNFLGVTTETISRQLTAFDNEGILKVMYRNVKIKDIKKLEDIVIPCQKSKKKKKSDISNLLAT
ncbi:MAG: fumarate/nitrate reduction transcriptional regulator Fnr [Gammaproteobacteria bacterium]